MVVIEDLYDTSPAPSPSSTGTFTASVSVIRHSGGDRWYSESSFTEIPLRELGNWPWSVHVISSLRNGTPLTIVSVGVWDSTGIGGWNPTGHGIDKASMIHWQSIERFPRLPSYVLVRPFRYRY